MVILTPPCKLREEKKRDDTFLLLIDVQNGAWTVSLSTMVGGTCLKYSVRGEPLSVRLQAAGGVLCANPDAANDC